MGKPRRNNSQKNWKNQSNKNNMQDAASDKEYDKGYRAGKDKARGRKEGAVYAVETGAKDNDPNWYVPNAQMVADVATFPFGIQTGAPLVIRENQSEGGSGEVSLPGIATFNVFPTVGDLADQTSPANIAGANLFQAMQVQSSRNPNYEMPDLMMYIIALSNVYSFYSWVTRAYGILNNFEFLNRYTPEALITAMGFDYDDLKTHVAEFRTGINMMANAISSLYLPKTIDFTNRIIFLYESIYTDAESAKAQYYMYNPVGFYKWVEGEVNSSGEAVPTYLKLESTLGTAMNVREILNYGWSLIDPLRGSDDIRMIGADMIKAFGNGNTVTANPVAETFVVRPGYNKEVLSQMENAFVSFPIDTGVDAVAGVITQDASINAGYLKSAYGYVPLAGTFERYKMDISKEVSNYIINFHWDSPTAADLLVATRLSQRPDFRKHTTSHAYGFGNAVVTLNADSVEIIPYTTEVVVGVTLSWYTKNLGKNGYIVVDDVINTDLLVDSGNGGTYLANFMQKIGAMSRFDWFPMVQPIRVVNAGSTVQHALADPLFDIDNFTLIGKERLRDLNHVAMLGLFTPKLDNVLQMR